MRRTIPTFAWCTFSVLLLVRIGASAATLHVPGDYATIQAAIDASVDGDEIIVAAGTYKEAINFIGMAVYLRSADGPEQTIIDASSIGGPVVTCERGERPSTVLEGFTITGGESLFGGGMYNVDSSPTVNHCRIIGNKGGGGGGVGNVGGSPRFSHCVFDGNIASSSRSSAGGGMLNQTSSPTLIDCAFIGNSAGTGGGMHNSWSSRPVLTNCTFSENAAGIGGGMYNVDSSPVLSNCTFSANDAGQGAGMSNDNANPTVSHCTFSINLAKRCRFNHCYGEGGGMYNKSSNPTFTNCTFARNVAGGAGTGGAMFNTASSPAVINCHFTGNWASGNNFDGGGDGGAMYNLDDSNPAVVNCVFTANASVWSGGAMTSARSNPTVTNCTLAANWTEFEGSAIENYESSLILTNSILWSDSTSEIYDSDGSKSVVAYCVVRGGYDGPGNIDAAPLFIRNPFDGGDGWGDDESTPDFDESSNDDYGDLRLTANSPCIDAGDPAIDLPPGTLDLDGHKRIWDGNTDGNAIVDIGAYEFSSHAYGDLNCDAGVDFNDIDAFVAALAGREEYEQTYPGCDYLLADVNSDGAVDFSDIDAFVVCLINGGCN